MEKKFHAHLFEIAVLALEPTLWEWRVFEGDTLMLMGFAMSRETAKMAADRALFRLLARGY
jgi:hypothetical protein